MIIKLLKSIKKRHFYSNSKTILQWKTQKHIKWIKTVIVFTFLVGQSERSWAAVPFHTTTPAVQQSCMFMLVFTIISIPTSTPQSQRSPSPKQTLLCYWFMINNTVAGSMIFDDGGVSRAAVRPSFLSLFSKCKGQYKEKASLSQAQTHIHVGFILFIRSLQCFWLMPSSVYGCYWFASSTLTDLFFIWPWVQSRSANHSFVVVVVFLFLGSYYQYD